MNLWDLSIFKMGLNQPLPGFLKWNNMECRGIIHHFFSSQSSIRYRYVAIAHCFIRISARFPYIYIKSLIWSSYISLYLFIYLYISLYIFIYLYISLYYLYISFVFSASNSWYPILDRPAAYWRGSLGIRNPMTELWWGFTGLHGGFWDFMIYIYIYIYILYLAGGSNHLEKWWSSSMGRMTSLLYEMKNWIHVPNHQPDDY